MNTGSRWPLSMLADHCQPHPHLDQLQQRGLELLLVQHHAAGWCRCRRGWRLPQHGQQATWRLGRDGGGGCSGRLEEELLE